MPPASPTDWEKAYRRLKDAAPAELDSVRDLPSLEACRVRLLGRKGELTGLLKQLKDLSIEDRRRFGPAANGLKEDLETRLAALQLKLEDAAAESELLASREDLSLPARPLQRGRRHPLTIAMERMTEILSRMGFSWAEGPLVEDDFHNFEALNFPPDHPARDTQDTFFLERGPSQTPLLMRTHTSPVQIRAMNAGPPPVRVMAPGRVFRHEAVDATHSHVFHQVEGLYVDHKVTMADLKGTLESFMKELFGPSTRVRFTPSYFPFVEPGAQVGATCFACSGAGSLKDGAPCPVCKRTGYIELLGAGLVHPNVIAAAGHDPKAWTGFAFGIGVERVAMLLFGVHDIRTFYENDLRFLLQFP